MKSGAWVALTAPKGEYLQDAKMLDLRGRCHAVPRRRHQIQQRHRHIDLKQSTAMGTDPVTARARRHLDSKGGSQR